MVTHSVFCHSSDWRLISERQCKDTAFFWNHQILGGDKGRFSAAFNLKLR